jgi:hypothetical protein
MFKPFPLLAVAFALIASPVVIAESLAEAEAKCKQWVQEEKVEKEDIDSYMAECISSLTEEVEQQSN